MNDQPPAAITVTPARLDAPHFSEADDPTLRFRLACVVSRGAISAFRYKFVGVQIQDVRYFGYSPDCVATVALTKKGDVSNRRRAIPDHAFDLIFRCHAEWERAGKPAEWVYQEFDGFVPLTARKLMEAKS